MAFRIEHRLGVPASTLAVWEVLGDVENWPKWQALYPEVKGALRIGGTIDAMEALPNAPPRAIRPVIADWTPESDIHWKTANTGGMIKLTRYFEIEKLTDTGCIFSNGQLFDGFMTRYVAPARKRLYRDAFQAFGEALRDEVMRRK
jgi:hypothetical protein